MFIVRKDMIRLVWGTNHMRGWKGGKREINRDAFARYRTPDTRPESRKQDFWKNMFTKICIWLLKRVRSSGKICFKSNF